MITPNARARVERSLRLIAELNPRLGAFVHVDADGARTAATKADAVDRASHALSPLHGMPIAIKDNIDVAGLPSGRGCPALVGEPAASRDAAAVATLRSLGAIVIGKTATHQFAYGPTGDRTGAAPSRNPHDPARISGGSSGGSAVAVASGMVPLALGTDTGGSVRIPAALCGVVGLKPTYDTLSTDGTYPLAPTLDHVGLLADSVGICEVAAKAFGLLDDTPWSLPSRIRWLRPEGFTPTDPRVTTRVFEALISASSEAAIIDTNDKLGHADGGPPWEECRRAFRAVQDREAYGQHAANVRDHPDAIDPEVLERLRQAGNTGAAEYVRALRFRAELRMHIERLFDTVDLLASPTTAVFAPHLDQRRVRVDEHTVSDTRDALLGLTSTWNLLGLPALTIPVGLVERMPVGLQLIGRPGAEATLLRTARHLVNPIERLAPRQTPA